MNKRGKIIVNVIDTGDGLLISDADIERYGLQYDKHYEGEFLPDGRYMITGHREPMTNHNNASEISGELLGVAEWIVHEYPKVADILTSTAETIKRLVAERDAAVNAEFTTRVNASSSVKDERQRAEAAEKRVAELEAERAHSEAAKGVNTQYAWALFHLGLSDDDDPEEFGRQLSDKIDGLEADLQQAREALEPFAEAADSYDPDEGDNGDVAWSHDFTIGSLRRARAARTALKGKQP